jgi:hypothetical protein
MSRFPICGCQDWLASRITSLGGIVSESQLHAFSRVADTPELLDSLALTLRLMNLGPQMQFFQERVLCLQQVVQICEEVWAVVNMSVLDGVRVADNVRGVLTSLDSDTLVGDEIANEGEDYE